MKICKEALEQPLTRDWKHTIDDRIARDSEFKEALEQPAWQGLTDDEAREIYCEVFDNCVNDFPSELNTAWFKALKEKNT